MIFNLFKKKKRNVEETVYENWKTSFRWPKKSRFIPEETEDYSAEFVKRSFSLKLKKKNLFAWVNISNYIYSDFVLEAAVSFGRDNGASAVGFVLRYVNEENFYYFLISRKGSFRFDVVFNGNPIHLIEWTENPLIGNERNNIRIIAHSSHFSFYIDDEWIGEFEDEMISRGEIGFAGQNFDDEEEAIFRLEEISIDSRPVSVEKYYYRWARYVPPDPEYRIKLAKTFVAMSAESISFLEPAAVQLKKAISLGGRNKEEHLLYADILARLKLYDLALSETEKALEMDSNYSEARVMKANILYLTNRFLESRDYIRSIIGDQRNNPILWALLGNSEYALGNWEASINAYQRAEELESSEALFILNRAKALEMLGEREKAFKAYMKASKMFFQNEDYNDLALCIEKAKRIDRENKELLALEAKMLFAVERKSEAERVIDRLISTGTEDSSIYFLKGLLEAERGMRKKAIELFEKAVKIEPDYYLYWFRLAENIWLNGGNPDREIERALDISPDDPWANNLYGQIMTEKREYERAEKAFKKAMQSLPDEPIVVINYSDMLSSRGENSKAKGIVLDLLRKIERENESTENRKNLADLYNHMGNLSVREKRYEEAILWYERALKLEKENIDYMINCASSCLEAGMISRADELLLKASEILGEGNRMTSVVYNLIGRSAWLKGEYRRAELAFREGIRIDPNTESCKLNLASMLMELNRYREAKALIEDIMNTDSQSQKGKVLLLRMRKIFERRLVCKGCGRVWWVPKEIPPQPPLKIIGEPPDELPAGRCSSCGSLYCVECAKNYIKGNRFTCPECNDFLKLSDNSLKYLWNEYLTKRND